MDTRSTDLLARALADAAHDLRNLVHVARSGTELMVDPDDPLTADVHGAVDSLAHLVDLVVEAARDSERDAAAYEPIWISDLLAVSLRRARRHGVEPTVLDDEAPVQVFVHGTAAERAIADALLLASFRARPGSLQVKRTAATVRITWDARDETDVDEPPHLRLVDDLQPLLARVSRISVTREMHELRLAFATQSHQRLAAHVDADESDVDALEAIARAPDLATCVALALDQIRVERARAAATERSLTALVEAGKSLALELTLRGVLRRIVELSCELVDCEYGALGVLDESGHALSEFITVGVDDATRAAIGDLPRGLGLLGVLINDPRPLRLDRMRDDPRSHGFPPNHPPMESFLGVPIVGRRRVKGRLYLTEKCGGGSFSAHDERIAMTLASQAAIAIENAELYEAMGAASDELTRANLQLQEADRHKSAFLANMSHELRTPLNSIIGYASLLLEDPSGLDDEQREDLRIIHNSSTHLLSLIADLLDLSQIETGHVQLRLSDVDCTRVARDVAASLRPQAEHEGTTIDVVAPEHLELRCDRSRLRQILLNITANAVKFTPRGTITIQITRVDGDVEFAVVDTGIGIPADDLGRIFESFFQSSAAMARTPRANEGAGLGLAITRDLAHLHEGRVSIDSTEGIGTTVRVILPLAGPSTEQANGADS